MRTFLTLALIAVLGGAQAEAATKRLFNDIKLPTQAVLERHAVSPAVHGTNQVLSANAGATSAAAASVTSFAAQPDVARNLIITPAGTTADVAACTVTVTGTNINGATITEEFAFADNAASATTGSKAFKTVTSVAWAASCEEGGFAATWSVGYGQKIGLHRCMRNAGAFSWAAFNGAYEATRPTVAADDNEVEKNTADLNSAHDGSLSEFYFVQNFGCMP